MIENAVFRYNVMFINTLIHMYTFVHTCREFFGVVRQLFIYQHHLHLGSYSLKKDLKKSKIEHC